MADLQGTSVFLVGMMGSGKSTVGKLVASHLGYTHLDTCGSRRIASFAFPPPHPLPLPPPRSDALVVQAAGASVASIFASDGEEGFRDAEAAVLNEVSSFARLVVSTGGGVVARPSNWAHLRHGVVVHLDAPLRLLATRVAADGVARRPLLADAPPGREIEHAEGVLAAVASARAPMYAEADLVVQQQPLSSGGDDESAAQAGGGASLECEAAEATAARMVRSLARLLAEDDTRERLRRVPASGDITLTGAARGPLRI